MFERHIGVGKCEMLGDEAYLCNLDCDYCPWFCKHEKQFIKERKVGEVFTYDGVRLKVVEGRNPLSCAGCYLYDEGYDCDVTALEALGFCADHDREDEKNVLFRQIGE